MAIRNLSLSSLKPVLTRAGPGLRRVRTAAVTDEKYDAIIVGGGTGEWHCVGQVLPGYYTWVYLSHQLPHRHAHTHPFALLTATAGCVLAERLSADERKKVLVLEAGGKVSPAGSADCYIVTLGCCACQSSCCPCQPPPCSDVLSV